MAVNSLSSGSCPKTIRTHATKTEVSRGKFLRSDYIGVRFVRDRCRSFDFRMECEKRNRPMLFAAGKAGDLVFRTGLPAREAIDHAPTLWRRRFDARQLAHVGGARTYISEVCEEMPLAPRSRLQTHCRRANAPGCTLRPKADAPSGRSSIFCSLLDGGNPDAPSYTPSGDTMPTNQRIPAIAVVCP